MKTMNTEPGRVIAPAMALLLLSVLAVPAGAQRGGRGDSGHQGQYSGNPGHRGGGHGAGSYSYGRGHGSYGYGHYGRGHSSYRGHYGSRGHGYKGHSGYYRGHGYSGHRGYHGYASYRGHYGYPSYSRPYNPYVYYGGPGYYGFGGYGYPGVSIHYQATPTYVVAGKTYPAPSYQSAIAIPGRTVTDSGEPYAAAPGGAAEPYDGRPPARVKLKVEPGDASVYLDGQFLGLASELPEELWIDPGAHRLEIARPGFAGRELDLELAAGEELDLDARLVAR